MKKPDLKPCIVITPDKVILGIAWKDSTNITKVGDLTNAPNCKDLQKKLRSINKKMSLSDKEFAKLVITVLNGILKGK